MQLYHGSSEKVKTPLLHKCRRNTDFGKGFYTTTDLAQATRWARIQQKRANAAKPIVSVYDLADTIFTHPDFSVYVFTSATEEWLRWVVANRNGIPTPTYDIITGPVANDNLYATLLLFEQGTFSVAQTIEKLQTYNLANQISFHTEKALAQLIFTKSYTKFSAP